MRDMVVDGLTDDLAMKPYIPHYKKYTPCLGINRGSYLFIGISYGADPKF